VASKAVTIHADLARQDDILPAINQDLPQQPFRLTGIINIGRIEKIDAAVQAEAQHASRRFSIS
jgi:hypothetical protein